MPGEELPAAAVTVCTACGHSLASDARFCGHCGRARSPVTPRPALVHRRRGTESRGVLLWKEFRPAFVLWALLLAVNGVLALIGLYGNVSSGVVLLLASLLGTILILSFCWVDRGAIAPLLRRFGLGVRTWWMLPAAFIFLAGFM